MFSEEPLWLLMHIDPVKNDRDIVVLFLCQFCDITALKQPIEDSTEQGMYVLVVQIKIKILFRDQQDPTKGQGPAEKERNRFRNV